MRPLLILIVAVLSVKYSSSQETSSIIEAGTRVNDIIPARDLYQYTEFLIGQVYFRDGSISQGKMNYNRLMDEMLFIDEKGDTLALNNEPLIKFVNIDKDTFYFDHGYIMLLKSSNSVKLGIRQGFRIADQRKAAAYDMTSSTSSVSSLSSFNDGNTSHQLVVNEQMILFKFSDYYFGDKYNHFTLANKENLRYLFPVCGIHVRDYFKKNKIDFEKRSDLEKVMSFIENSCQ